MKRAVAKKSLDTARTDFGRWQSGTRNATENRMHRFVWRKIFEKII